MCRVSLPPGFRFCPSDQELVLYYLKRKNLGKPFHFDAIAEVDIYQFAPEELPGKSCLKTKDQEWYFFCPRYRKYSNGRRTNRSTHTGCWKITGKDRPIGHDSRTVGKKKTLIFYSGRGEHSLRTDWIIHEYMLEDPYLTCRGVPQDKFVLCKLYRKSGLGPRQHVPPFEEEEGEDDEFEISSILSSWTSVGQQYVIDAVDQPVHTANGNMQTPQLEPDTPGAVFTKSQDPNDNISRHSDDVIDSTLYEILCDDNGDSFVQDISFERPLVAPLLPDNMYNGIRDNDRPAESVHQVPVVDSGKASGIPHNELEEMLMSCGGEYEYDTEVPVGATDSWYVVAGNDLGSTLHANSVHSFGSDDDYYPVANEHWGSQGGCQPEPESGGL